MKYTVLFASLFSFSVGVIVSNESFSNSDIKVTSLFVPHNLGPTEVHFKHNEFYVNNGGKEYRLKKYLSDSTIQSMSPDKLLKLQQIGHIAVTKTNDNEFVLRSHIHGNGGGPITATCLYWITKGLSYGCLGLGLGTGVAATTAAVAATGPVGLAAASGFTYATTAVTGGAMLAATATPAAVTGAFVIGSVGGTAAATTATAATLAASGGSVAAIVAGIETASTAAAVFGMALPLP